VARSLNGNHLAADSPGGYRSGVELSVRISGGSEADLIAVADLHQESRNSAYRHILPPADLPTDPAPMRAHWISRFPAQQPAHRLLLAEADGALAGFSYFGPDTGAPDAGPGIAMLNALHVRPAAVGTGVGRLLMIRTLEIMTADGVRTVRLWVLAENRRAREFYSKGGWEPDGTTRESVIGGTFTQQLRYSLTLTASGT
jgi:GNAT superfamily N-acetyltransferase